LPNPRDIAGYGVPNKLDVQITVVSGLNDHWALLSAKYRIDGIELTIETCIFWSS